MSYYNPIIGNDYNKLVQAMVTCDEMGDLPQALEIKDTTGITIAHIQDLITEFERDTGLSMRFEAEMCSSCKKLHAFLCVDNPDEEEPEPSYLN